MRCEESYYNTKKFIIEKIYSQGISIKKKARQEGTIQNDALKWILQPKNFILCPSSNNIIQRYAATTVFMGLQKQEDLSFDHECQWSGFKCNHSGEITEISFGKLEDDIMCKHQC